MPMSKTPRTASPDFEHWFRPEYPLTDCGGFENENTTLNCRRYLDGRNSGFRCVPRTIVHTSVEQPFPPDTSDFDIATLERDECVSLSGLSNWAIICEEVLDTEHSHVYLRKCYEELRRCRTRHNYTAPGCLPTWHVFVVLSGCRLRADRSADRGDVAVCTDTCLVRWIDATCSRSARARCSLLCVITVVHAPLHLTPTTSKLFLSRTGVS